MLYFHDRWRNALIIQEKLKQRTERHEIVAVNWIGLSMLLMVCVVLILLMQNISITLELGYSVPFFFIVAAGALFFISQAQQKKVELYRRFDEPRGIPCLW